MSKEQDAVYLANGSQAWPVELAEKLLSNPQPWGPPTYAFGVGYTDDPQQPDQSDDFFKLAYCVKGAYKRRGDMGEAWHWVNSVIESKKEGHSYAEYTTQDLLDIVFLHVRGERFSDGLIRSTEPVLREIIGEVVKRVHSSTPPVFLTQK